MVGLGPQRAAWSDGSAADDRRTAQALAGVWREKAVGNDQFTSMEEREIAVSSIEAWKGARSSCIHAVLTAFSVLTTLSTTWNESTVLYVGAVVFVLVGLIAAAAGPLSSSGPFTDGLEES